VAYSQRKGLFGSLMRRLFLSIYDGFCVPNDRAIEWLDIYVPELDKKHIVKLPNLVNEDLFSREVIERKGSRRELRRTYDIDQEDLTLLCPARLQKGKGIGAFLDAVRDRPFGNVTILIAGDGPERAKLEATGKRMDSIKTRFLGFCQEQQMLDLYALSDIFLLPSFQDSNPLTVIEACHAGLPLLISRRLGNYPETLQEGENGWAFNPNDPSSIREALESAVSTSRKELESMGSFSSEIGEQTFGTRKAVRRFVDSLENIVNTKNA
jgi:glycosyltransferase involved in cell wall biosynthesis